jgi:putative ATP-binding cassette transporter
VNRNLGFFTTGYNNLIQLIPALIVAPLFIHGQADFGVISQSAMAFAYVVGAFSLVVTQFPSLSSYAAVLARLSPLVGFAGMPAPAPADGIAVVEDERHLALEHLTLLSPQDGAILLSDLTADVAPGERLLVTSATERVTDVLQRAIAGLWDAGEGRIVRPPLNDVRFLPDREYLPPGTLREFLTGNDPRVTEEQIQQALRTTGADRAVARVGLDVERDWDDVLSVDEQRLVGLAYVLIVPPRFLVVSHVEAGLGNADVASVLEAFTARRIGCMALGDGAIGREHFDRVIEIRADGTWNGPVPRRAAS